MAKYIVAALMMCVTLSACVSGSGRFYAGTYKVDITPDQAVVAAEGESFRLPDVLPEGEKTPPDNIRDDDHLYARVVVLKDKDVSLAIVSVDALMFSSERVVEQAKELWGLDHVILNATHTHSGMVPRKMCPSDDGWAWCFELEDPAVNEKLDWSGFDEDPWYAETEQKIIVAIGMAARDLFPAKVSSGHGPVESDYLAHNRRLVLSDGTVSMLWENISRRPTEPLDPTVRVIRVDDELGNPRALLVHYACHPVMLMGAGVISRDFPGAMVDYVEEKLGEDCMAMFLQGAGGDIDPYEINLRGDSGFKKMRQAGASLGEAALAVAQELPASQEETDACMQVKENLLTIPYDGQDKSSEVCVTTVVINKNLALVTIPGSVFIQHQLNLAEKLPGLNALLLGLTYCGQGSPFVNYVPTVQAVKEGGRGAEDCRFLVPDAGDRMLNAAVESINELVGEQTPSM